MSKPIIKHIEQKTLKITHSQYKKLGEELEKVERGIAVATSLLYLIRDSEEFKNYVNISIGYGLWQAATDLEERFEELEKYVSSLTKPDEREEEKE